MICKRLTDLNKAIAIRQKELEHKTLEALRPVYGGPQVIEVELAKLKVIVKGEDRQAELEDALREAQAFNQEVQDMLAWLDQYCSVPCQNC